eukprot:gene8329-5839_t
MMESMKCPASPRLCRTPVKAVTPPPHTQTVALAHGGLDTNPAVVGLPNPLALLCLCLCADRMNNDDSDDEARRRTDAYYYSNSPVRGVPTRAPPLKSWSSTPPSHSCCRPCSAPPPQERQRWAAPPPPSLSPPPEIQIVIPDTDTDTDTSLSDPAPARRLPLPLVPQPQPQPQRHLVASTPRSFDRRPPRRQTRPQAETAELPPQFFASQRLASPSAMAPAAPAPAAATATAADAPSPSPPSLPPRPEADGEAVAAALRTLRRRVLHRMAVASGVPPTPAARQPSPPQWDELRCFFSAAPPRPNLAAQDRAARREQSVAVLLRALAVNAERRDPPKPALGPLTAAHHRDAAATAATAFSYGALRLYPGPPLQQAGKEPPPLDITRLICSATDRVARFFFFFYTGVTFSKMRFLFQVPQFLKDAAEEYLFESTQQMIADIITAPSATAARDVFVARAKEGGTEFWLDVCIILAMLLMTIALVNCFSYCCCWFCVGMPKQAQVVNKIRSGALDYQKKAEQERAERKLRGEPEDDGLEEDFRAISRAMNEMRDYLRESEARLQPEGDSVLESEKDKQKTGDTTEAAQAPASGVRTRRKPNQVLPASLIRGLSYVDVMAASPNQRHFLVGSRSKKATYVIPQGDVAFLRRGKELLKKGSPFTIVEDLEVPLPASVKRMEVYSAQFVPVAEQSVLVIGERNTDTFFVFSVTGDCDVSLQRCLKMPGHRLVSSLTHWGIATNGAGGGMDGLVHFQTKDCVVELLTASSNTFTTATNKFKIGNATAWCHLHDLVAVGGSFMREPRLARIERRDHGSASAFELKPVVTLPASHGSTGGSALRAVATALVTSGLPAFNTRNYWIVLFEDGTGQVLDLDAMRSTGSPEVVCIFTDTDYAEYTPEEPVRLLVAVRGTAYKEQLVLLLVRGGNVTVLHQSGFVAPFEMIRRLDIFDALSGTSIAFASLLLGGRGLALCGAEDHRGVRLFELPDYEKPTGRLGGHQAQPHALPLHHHRICAVTSVDLPLHSFTLCRCQLFAPSSPSGVGNAILFTSQSGATAVSAHSQDTCKRKAAHPPPHIFPPPLTFSYPASSRASFYSIIIANDLIQAPHGDNQTCATRAKGSVRFIRVPPRSHNKDFWFSEYQRIVKKGMQFEVEPNINAGVEVDCRLQLCTLAMSSAASPSRGQRSVVSVLNEQDLFADPTVATNGQQWFAIGRVGPGEMTAVKVILPPGSYQLRCQGEHPVQIFAQAWDVERHLS